MRRLAIALAGGVAGYVLGALAGYFLIDTFSANTHDRSVEAAMTAAFVSGPLAAVVAFVVGFLRSGRNAAAPDDRALAHTRKPVPPAE